MRGEPAFETPRVVLWFVGAFVAVHILGLLSGELYGRYAFLPLACVLGEYWWCFSRGLTYSVLHASWGHVLVNGIFLLAFGTPVARRLGAWGFMMVAAAGSWGGALAYGMMHATDAAYLVGGSAVTSAMLGSATRFVFRAGGELHRGGDPKRQAMIFIGVWFGVNLLTALVSDGIAWEAHIGGFIAGWLLTPLLLRRGGYSGGVGKLSCDRSYRRDPGVA